LKLTSHGAVGFAMINGETVGDVVRMCSRYYRLMNPLYSLTLVPHGRLVAIEFRRAMAVPERCRRFYEETIAVSIYQQLVPFLKERPPRHFEIRLGMPAPPHVAAYAELRGANVIFGDADNDGVTMYLDTECLDIRNPLADANSREIAEELCRRRCAELDQRHGWADWVAKALRTADGSRPTQSDLASLLHMSPRTLERALAREGASFKDIYERVGFERACEMLCERRHSISAIAERLGYSSIGAFSRAFKRRSGLTPSEYLAQHADK
jgi:AraC-like DNA-binding protein